MSALNRHQALVAETILGAAGTFVGEVHSVPRDAKSLAVESIFVRAAAGTSTKVFVQTSLDGGVTWVDIISHAFLITTASKLSAVSSHIATAAAVTPTDGALTDDTILDGVLGDRVRVKWIVAGTYTGASSIHVVGVFSQ